MDARQLQSGARFGEDRGNRRRLRLERQEIEPQNTPIHVNFPVNLQADNATRECRGHRHHAVA